VSGGNGREGGLGDGSPPAGPGAELWWGSGKAPEAIQGAPIKNNPLAKMLYFSHGSMNLRQTFRLCMRIFTQHILQILLK